MKLQSWCARGCIVSQAVKTNQDCFPELSGGPLRCSAHSIPAPAQGPWSRQLYSKRAPPFGDTPSPHATQEGLSGDQLPNRHDSADNRISKGMTRMRDRAKRPL